MVNGYKGAVEKWLLFSTDRAGKSWNLIIFIPCLASNVIDATSCKVIIIEDDFMAKIYTENIQLFV